MTFLKSLFNFYVSSSIHVALAVYCLVRVSEIYFETNYNENLNYFIFYATITGYNFVKYAGIAKFYHKSLTKNLQLIQIFSFVCFLLTCYYGYLLPLDTLLLFSPFILLTALYTIPFLGGFQKNLREISFLKIFIVAAVWAGVTTTIPLLNSGYDSYYILSLLFVQRMLFVVVLILPFEIRDLQLDIEHVKTLPQIIGVQQTKRFGLACLLIILTLEFLITNQPIFRNTYLLICFVLLLFLMRSKEKQSKYYSSFWVEALPILWWILLLLLY